ncbi:hypothetical protein [Schlesneria sp. DSM 10557]|uniref:hypothetical protein n=1 Tax=Schlesneria sp. DSM 10557 TaxID=3044399 RepID=UPI00359FDAA0
MAKKRPQEGSESSPIEADLSPMKEAIIIEDLAGEAPANLKSEIETFISLRDELARKLADEIAATELKLAQLRETAASLFPRTSDSPEDKKAKKPKPKPAKEEKPSSVSAEEQDSTETSES